MAAAGTLSRPTSAQGSYSLSPYHTYYSPPSPTIAGTYSRPSSAGANYASESYSPFRKSTTRPVISRLATSSQYIPSTSPDAPTRIYGTRSAIHSADDLSATTLQKATPVQLQRNYTAPDLRPLIRGPNRQLNKLQTLDINSSQSDKFTEGKERTTPVPRQNTVETTTTTSDLPTVQLKRASRTGPFEDVGIELAPPVTQEPGAKDDTSSPPSRGFVTSTTSVQEELSDFAPLTGHPMPPLTSIGHNDNVVEDSKDSGTVQTSAPPLSSEATILKDIHSGNDLDSDAQRSALLPPGTPATDQGKYEELSNMRLPPRSQTPVPANYLSPEKSKSLKNRLRRALSLGSSSKLSEYGTDEQLQNFQATPVPVQRADHIYGQRNRSMDNISVASNASSASMILRKLSHGLTKKTKRSFSSLFSGSRSNYAKPSGESVEAPQPRVSPVVGNVNYINAEPRPDDRPQSPQREIFNSHTRAQGSMSTNRSPSVPAKVEVTQAASNVDGHGSVAFPRLSEEMAIDEDRSRRASMHLERPLPIDLAEHSITPVNEPSEASLSSSFGLGRPDHIGSISKGILKRSRDIQGQSPQAQSKDVTPPTAQADHGFDFSFDPVPEIAKFSLSANELTPPSTTPTAQTTPTSVITPIVQASKTGGPLKFSPRITIHDTYTANEYDRRGELATCNRLTPLLAQRIKEELNAYKMDEMQVAEESKMYTHFFS